MAIVSGVNIPDGKRLETALTSIYGIGTTQAKDIADRAGLFDNPRVNELSEDQLNVIREIVDQRVVEGDLRREINQNIRRLIDIGCYRGTRHRRSLPVRGQRTMTYDRSKRGRTIAVARSHTTSK